MINEALRLVRVFHDLSQKELSERISVSKSYISELESGKKRPTLTLLEKYSEVFKIPVSSLLFFSENMDDTNLGADDKARVFISGKVLAIMRFVAERSGRDLN